MDSRLMIAVAVTLLAREARATFPERASVRGGDVTTVTVMGGEVSWSSVGATDVPPGPRSLSFVVPADLDAVLVPVCAGRKRILLDGVEAHVLPGEVVLDVPRDGHQHRVSLTLDVSGYEHRVTCGQPPRIGVRTTTREGLVAMSFASPHAASGGGRAVVYVPPGHDLRRPAPVLVGLHPWNGSVWTYAAYEELVSAARDADVVLLFPSGLGNSLYTADAEDEALRAMRALGDELAVDPDRVTLWGASMGGAGATTIGFHHPDRFAAIVSLFGDSKYDLATYVKSILHDGAGAHLVNALDVVDNARNVPVWLIHGEDDRVSSLGQSAMLARALHAKGFTVTFDRVPGAGHEGRVVREFARRIVDLGLHARRIGSPLRVSYWSVRPSDVEAYGIRMTRIEASGDAFFDLERVADTVRLRSAVGVRALRLPRGAFQLSPRETAPIVCDDPAAKNVSVTWDAPP